MTYLHTDGMDDANLVSLSSSQVLRQFIIAWATVILLCLATFCYHYLCGQIYDVHKASVKVKE
jgi:hypothetical protein